jgi:hypothetical protein
LGSASEGDEYTVSESTRFLASWVRLYTITFSAGVGSGTPPEPQKGTAGTVITLPGQGDMTAPEGMAFDGWTDTDSGNIYEEGARYTVSTRDRTFMARWARFYTITFSSGEGSGTPPEPLEGRMDGSITLPGQEGMTPPDRTSFSGWRDDSSSRTYEAGSSYRVSADTTLTAYWEPWIPQGVYIGVISFAGGVTAITPAGGQSSKNDSTLYYLDQSGKSDLNNRLNSRYNQSTEGGTALYYAVHKALANLTEAEPVFSNDAVQSINLITFTDGLDNGSFGASNTNPIDGKSGVISTEYAAYIKEQIGSRTIGGVPITAYSIGVQGSDVQDVAAFNTTLSSIASADGNVSTLTSIDELHDKFTEIASSVNIDSAVNFRMVTTQNDPGTVIRMTFDNAANAEAATRYIDGTLAYDSATGRWSLTNIQYSSSLASESGAEIRGVVSGDTVSFTFKEISGYDPRTDTAKQWTKAPGSSSWQINSEYSASGSADTTVDTMFVYLVLDASTSLNSSQITQIRTAVNSFIDTLYDRTHPTY